MTADDAHHQPRPGAGVAEIQGLARRQQRAEAGPVDGPAARPVMDDLRAELAARRAGAQNVLAFEQAVNLDAAAGQQAEQESAMRDRLVARRPDATAQRAAAAGFERRFLRLGHGSARDG